MQLGDKNNLVSCAAAISLHKLGDTSGINILLSDLRIPDNNYRLEIVRCLSNTTNIRVIDELIAAVNDDNKRVAEAAIETLGKARATQAIDRLISILGDTEFGLDAAISLHLIGVPALSALINALEDLDDNVRRNAALALRLLENKDSVKPLIAVLKNDTVGEVRRQAALALGLIGDISALTPLKDSTKDPVNEVQKDAILARSRLGDRKVIPDLIGVEVKLEHFWAVCIKGLLRNW